MEKNKNSGLIVLVILLVIGLVGSVGYIVYDKVLNKSEKVVKEEKKESNKKAIKIDSNKELVYDLVNKEIDHYSGEKTKLILPYININSNYAKEVNEEISKLKVKFEKEQTGGTSKSFINDNIISIVINTESEGDYSFYYTYNIDKNTGEYISPNKLLKYKNITEEEIISKLDLYIKQKYDSFDRNIFQEGEIIRAHEESSNYNSDVLRYPMYINENKELVVMSYFQELAGGIPPHAYMFNIDKNKIEK